MAIAGSGCSLPRPPRPGRACAIAAAAAWVLLLAAQGAAKCDFRAVFNFGDSNSETGGFWAAFPAQSGPFGMTYFGRPAGRASDGRAVIDFLAQAIGIPLLSPYLQSIGSNYKHGANYATAASTVLLPNTSVFVSGISPFSLAIQLNQMKQLKVRALELGPKGYLPSKDVFGKSLYTLDIGQNDFTGNLAAMGIEGVKQFLPQVAATISWTIKELGLDPMNQDLITSERAARANFELCLTMENSFAGQRSKQHWLTDMDNNSKFFYASIRSRRMTCSIRSCKLPDGSLSTDFDLIKQQAVSFYSDLLNRPAACGRANFQGVKSLTSQQFNILNRPFTADEIKAVIFSAPANKSPGPDGFPADFYQACWPIIGDDVVRAVFSFFCGSNWHLGANSTFISLIPKNDSADSFEDFRPISLCNYFYKIIAKLLANRMQLVMNSLIHEAQSAFIKGRKIQDSILLANDLIRNLHSKSKGNLLCIKVDLRKAFDTVDRHFILDMMTAMGFPQQWVTWVSQCINTSAFSVLLNGAPHGYFQSSNGVRQGCPLSPYLFCIAMEGLSLLLERAVNSQNLKVPTYRGVSISHLLFADDLLVFLKPSEQYVKHFASIMDDFYSFSGLQLNESKSRVFFAGGVERKNRLLAALSMRAGALPVRYLGLPLTSTGLKFAHFAPLLSNIKNRISAWRTRLLSKAGRLELIRSVLFSYTIYWAMAFIIPKSVIGEVDRLLRNFYWHASGSYKPFHLLRWDLFCRPKCEGGVGLFKLQDWNKAAVAKHLWDIITDRPSLLTSWLKVRYLYKTPIWQVKAQAYHSAAWKGILALRPWLLRHISIQQGPEGTVTWNHNNGKIAIAHFYDQLRPVHPKVDWEDVVWQRPTCQKYSLFLWQVLLGGIASYDKLCRMGFHGPSLCFLCYQNEESIDHLFFSCTFSAWIWMEVLKRLGLVRQPKVNIHLEISSLLGSFWRKGAGTSLCFIAIRASVWWIWKERCTRIFNATRRSKMQVLLSILRDVQNIAHDMSNGIGHSSREKIILQNFNIALQQPSQP